MSLFQSLASSEPAAFAILLLAVVIASGLVIGHWRWRGLKLGTTGVLFSGLLFGHWGFHLDEKLLGFVREFGLILFVFTIGLQLGPGFFSSLRRDGLRLNGLAAAVVVLGVGLTVLLPWLVRLDWPAAVGLLAGATTNTPSLGAAQQTVNSLSPPLGDRAALPALAYAVAYPGGILGIIGSLLLLRLLLRVDLAREASVFRSAQSQGSESLERQTLRVTNPRLIGTTLGSIPGLKELGVTVSRVRRANEAAVELAGDQTPIELNEELLVVGTRHSLNEFSRVVGPPSRHDLLAVPGGIQSRRIVVTRRAVLGRTLGELSLHAHYGVVVTRLARNEVEWTAGSHQRLRFGDVVQVVGSESALEKAADGLGDAVHELHETQFVPLFAGIALGVLVGLIPMALPGIPSAIRLGLAGGPLIIAILLGRLGHWGPLVWHMPLNTNLAFRELGITLFLACVGIKAGAQFFQTVWSTQGLIWLLSGLIITTIPLLVVGFCARRFFRLNFLTLSGLLAGSMTDPPALSFACGIARSDAPTGAYASVYPLTMILRILSTQLLVLLWGS
jgi:putative transport protein